jgi:site-specific DNA-methyltransferase (adenine-specific)
MEIRGVVQQMIRNGDCLEVMAAMPAESVDAIVTDPPYGLEFMGKSLDAPWKATSGGFASPGIGARKTDWPSYKGSNLNRCEACGLLIGQGGSPCRCEKPKPKRQDAERMRVFQEWCRVWAGETLRIAKPGAHIVAFGGTRTYHRLACALEDAGWEIRDSLMWLYGTGFPKSLNVSKAIDKATGIAPSTDATKPWSGWGTALKPAFEPIILARKPLIGTVATNVLTHGTGAINVDGCRVSFASDADKESAFPGGKLLTSHSSGSLTGPGAAQEAQRSEFSVERNPKGRWPANVLLDEDAAAALDEQTGELSSGKMKAGTKRANRGGPTPEETKSETIGDSRFFYCAKASSSERHAAGDNTHPTVKPVALMRWLCRLITPPGGVVLDPFCGSGSTGVAALEEGFQFVGIEKEAEYAAIAAKRVGCEVVAAEPAVVAEPAKPAEPAEPAVVPKAKRETKVAVVKWGRDKNGRPVKLS